MAILCYALGVGIAAMIGAAVAQPLAEQHGWRKVLPIVLPAALAAGFAIGWGLIGELQAIEASSHT